MARYQEIEKKQMDHEAASKTAMDRYALERRYNKAKPSQMLEYIINGERPDNYLYAANKGDGTWDELRRIIENYRGTMLNKGIGHLKYYNEFLDVLRVAIRKANTFFDKRTNIIALRHMMEIYGERIRNIEDWKPRRNNTHTVLYDLLRHMFCEYTAPEFLVNSFINNEHEGIHLFQHIGVGKSIKSYIFHPTDMVITNKCYHYLMSTPAHCTLREAYRRSQILMMGGDDCLFRDMMESRLGQITNQPRHVKAVDEFWLTVVKFFIENGMIAPEKIGEIIDYIYDQKFEVKRTMGADGVLRTGIDQPNFTMKGRTPQSLLTQSDEWHQYRRINLNRMKAAQTYSSIWGGLNIPKFIYDNSDDHFFIVQLLSTNALIDEVNQMKHCVGSYSNACSSGRCSIFSLRLTNHTKKIYERSLVTVEVRVQGSNLIIGQAKAKANQKPEPYHTKIISKWAELNRITVPTYTW